jgi:nitrogenase molybdenum-iron protein beta chain
VVLGRCGPLLDTQCKVPCTVLDMPFGLKATDRFIDALRIVSRHQSCPTGFAFERGSWWI